MGIIMTTLQRKEFKKIRNRKSFGQVIDNMLVNQSYKCNICKCDLFIYEKCYYSYPKNMYEPGGVLYGMDNYYTMKRSIYEVDHIIPLAKGGTNTVDNYQLLCRECNIRKGIKIC